MNACCQICFVGSNNMKSTENDINFHTTYSYVLYHNPQNTHTPKDQIRPTAVPQIVQFTHSFPTRKSTAISVSYILVMDQKTLKYK